MTAWTSSFRVELDTTFVTWQREYIRLEMWLSADYAVKMDDKKVIT